MSKNPNEIAEIIGSAIGEFLQLKEIRPCGPKNFNKEISLEGADVFAKCKIATPLNCRILLLDCIGRMDDEAITTICQSLVEEIGHEELFKDFLYHNKPDLKGDNGDGWPI